MNKQYDKYDLGQTYLWNYNHSPPDMAEVAVEPIPGDWKFCGLPVDSPLGIAAGPLLNGQWCLYYARLGFDVLTYKTVRSSHRECYAPPNLLPVDCPPLDGSQTHVKMTSQMNGTWAVSFGMPSADPEDWRRDIESIRKKLPDRKLLNVSVVGTMQDGWGIQELADDYARCAAWAIDSGADCVETNFSCPNVDTCDGQLYQSAVDSAQVVATVRAAIGNAPYIVKIGHTRDEWVVEGFLTAVAPYVDAIALTNSIGAKVSDGKGILFEGQQRGICGAATRNESIAQVAQFKSAIDRLGIQVELIGIGGIAAADHVRSYLNAGAASCHLATAVMVDPGVALKIRDNW